MNCSIKNYISTFDTFFKYLIADEIIPKVGTNLCRETNNQKIFEKNNLNVLYNFLQTNLKNTDFNTIKTQLVMSSYKNTDTENNSKTCISILKTGPRKNQLCGKKSTSSSDYCKTHHSKIYGSSKSEENESKSFSQSEDTSTQPSLGTNTSGYPVGGKEEDDVIVIRKNKHNNFVFGNTGLIIKSAKEKYIVAREAEDGNWIPLTRDDIEECERYHLKYKIIDFNFKGEKTNKTIVKSTQMLPDTKEKAVMFEDFIEDDNFIQSDITPK